jgi:LacI family transcriptional regulator
MAKKATINMVAEAAGVSRGTVDRVLNQRPHVKPEVKERVLRAMRELKYLPPHEEQAEALGLTLDTEQPPRRLGVLLPAETGYFFSEVMQGIEAARSLLRTSNVEILVEKCDSGVPYEYVERLDRLEKAKISGLAVFAKNNPDVIARINEMASRGIAIVTLNSDLPGANRLCFIGQDPKQSGRVAGELMAKCLRPEDTLLIGVGNPEFEGHRLRLEGFLERMKESGFAEDNMPIIKTFNDYDLTAEKVRAALKKHPEIRGIYMANHSVTGCADAVRELGLAKQLRIISHDLTRSTKRLLESREIDFVITQNIYDQGYQPLICLQNYLEYGTIPDSDIGLINIVCAENLFA